jgi:hypothetical protein
MTDHTRDKTRSARMHKTRAASPTHRATPKTQPRHAP